MKDYLNGHEQEIYCMPILDLFAGCSFAQVAFIVERAFDGEIILLGVEERCVLSVLPSAASMFLSTIPVYVDLN